MSFNKDIPYNALPDLPPKINLETPEIFKLTIKANKLLAELKGYCQTLPDPHLLLNSIVLQESKESSAIENIVTTQDELYRATLSNFDQLENSAAKEVIQYRAAMYWGLEELKKKQIITTNLLVGVMQNLRGSTENIRKNSGTKLANPISKKVIYTPPEGEDIIRDKLANLEKFINDDELYDLDPLIKLALLHYQFEAIHPFSDGNGRTGRILNILYLVNKNLLGMPVLYLSKYIIENKADYYRLLKEVTEKQNWTDWVKFVLQGIANTSETTLFKINAILTSKNQLEPKIKELLKSSYSRELTDLLFSHPYIKIKTLEEFQIAKRATASAYLNKLVEANILSKIKVWKETYFINTHLMDVLSK